jgi:hypothetical protein
MPESERRASEFVLKDVCERGVPSRLPQAVERVGDFTVLSPPLEDCGEASTPPS